MSETFRSKVEEIVSDNCMDKECKRVKLCDYCKVEVDRICAALKERVEGMPMLYKLPADETPTIDLDDTKKIARVSYARGIEKEREACKSYMLEGLDELVK
jgi:hypothetical protein